MGPVQDVESLSDLGIAPEEKRGVLLLEGEETRVRRSTPIPVGWILRIDTRHGQTALESLEGFLLAQRHEIDDLGIREDRIHVAGRDSQWKDLLTEGAGLGDLRETPFRLHRVLGADHHQRAADPQLPIQLLFPIASALEPRRGIEIQEERTMTQRLQPSHETFAELVVDTAMADENGAHLSSGRVTNRSPTYRCRYSAHPFVRANLAVTERRPLLSWPVIMTRSDETI